MSNYRRLISYIYEYEGKTKGRNVGFAKLEARGGQCRINVNVKKIFTNGDAGIYLLSSGGEILLGKLFLRGGNGEFRTSVQVDNVEGSGCEMDSCYGLAIHEPKDDWRTYRTIWEDEVTCAAEIELSKAAPESEPAVMEEAEKAVAEIEKELAREEYRTIWEDEVTCAAEIELSKAAPESEPAVMEEAEKAVAEIEKELAREEGADGDVSGEKNTEETESAQIDSQPVLEAVQAVSTKEGGWTGIGVSREKSELPYIPQAGNPGELEDLRLIEEPEENAAQMWSRFEKLYPKIQAFDSEHGCEILVIKPQDIGLLPREAWVYGNNSFLLHGYYNYRYLILARLENPRGKPRHLLGVPGHYYSNEKYMANMFGFPHFVLSKKQPSGDGRFGFWYTDIRFT